MRRAGRGDPGETAWFTFGLSPVRDEAGEIVAFFNPAAETTGRVVAERRLVEAREAAERAEMRLREVFTQAPAFLAVVRGRDHVFDFANEAYYQLVGRRDILGKPVVEALPEVRDQGFVEILDRVLATGEPFVGREIPVALVRSPGEPPERRFVDFIYQPLREAGATPVGIVAHGSDVTAQVEARREIEAARAEAEEASRAKSEFLATMSHELRTPLNAIGGYAELLLVGVRGELTPAQREDVERIRRSGTHLLGLINDILNFARLEAGQVEFRIDSVPLAPLVGEIDDLIPPQVAAKTLRYEAATCDPTIRLCADPEKVRQIILNLVANAVKFTDPGGVVAVRCDVDGAMARVHVLTDTGIGIPADKLEAVFDPFVQVDTRLTRETQGTGLGLAISRDLARGMGGTLSAQSEIGKGSTFTLSLPLDGRGAGSRE